MPDVFNKMIQDGYVPICPTQGVNVYPCHAAKLNQIPFDPSTPLYFIQVCIPNVTVNKMWVFQGKEFFEVVSKWCDTFIDLTKQHLIATVHIISHKPCGVHDKPSIERVTLKKLRDSLERELGCETRESHNGIHYFEVHFYWESLDLKLGEKFLVRLENILLSYGLIEKVGAIIDAVIWVNPRQSSYSSDWERCIDGGISDSVKILTHALDGNILARDAAKVLMTIKSQITLRAKIIIGYSFLEEIFYKKEESLRVLKLNKTNKSDLSSKLLEQMQLYLTEIGKDELDEKSIELFKAKISEMLALKTMTKNEIISINIARLLGEPRDEVHSELQKAFENRSLLAHRVKPDLESLNLSILFIERVIESYITQKIDLIYSNFTTIVD